jgi:hypothetical protein
VNHLFVLPHTIRWATYPERPTVEHVGIDPRGEDDLMAQQLLDGTDVLLTVSRCVVKEWWKVWLQVALVTSGSATARFTAFFTKLGSN